MSTVKPRVYIDTNIFIYHLSPTQAGHLKQTAKRFFMDIQQQKLIGVASSFTKSEYVAVIKEALANQSQNIPNQNTINYMMTQFDNFISNMGIEYFDTDDLTTDNKFFINANMKVESSVPMKGKDGQWRGLNGADSVVLTCAERTRSDKIATNDDGFKGINSSVRPLIVREVY